MINRMRMLKLLKRTIAIVGAMMMLLGAASLFPRGVDQEILSSPTQTLLYAEPREKVPKRASDSDLNALAGLKYRLSPLPSRSEASDPKGGVLTDERLVSGRFWDNGQSVGWRGDAPVIVEFDLPTEESLDSVVVTSAARLRAEIYPPSQFIVYGGDVRGGFQLLASSPIADRKETGLFAAQKAVVVRFAPVRVRHLVIVIYLDGQHLFLTEISALRTSVMGLPSRPDVQGREALLASALQIRRGAFEAGGAVPSGNDKARRWSVASRAVESNGACAILPVDPWEPEAANRSNTLGAFVGGQDYLRWRLLNSSGAPAHIELRARETSMATVHFYALSLVRALDRSWRPDVAAPFQEFDLPAGEEAHLLAEISPREPGSVNLSIELSCGEARSRFSASLVSRMPAKSIRPIHGNLWAMLHRPPHMVVRDAIRCDASALAKYGMDTAVIHFDAVWPKNGEYPTALLASYFREFANMDRLMVEMWGKRADWPFMAMDEEDSRVWLRNWWGWIRRTADDAGYKGELLLYPVDEPQGDSLAKYRQMVARIRNAELPARIFVTVDSKTVLQSIEGTAQVVQIARKAGEVYDQLWGAEELHLYDAAGDARLLSAQNYYRRQGWQAYHHNLSGIGNWAIFDTPGLNSPATGWSPAGERERDFGMLYSAPDGCGWPSIRLLAWRRGLEENRILRQCRRPGKNDEAQRSLLSKLPSAEMSRYVVKTLQSCVRK